MKNKLVLFSYCAHAALSLTLIVLAGFHLVPPNVALVCAGLFLLSSVVLLCSLQKKSVKHGLTSVALVFALALMTLPTTGCSKSTVINEINVVLEQSANILVVAEPRANWVPQFQAAIVALKNAEAEWQGGGTVQNVIDALNTVEAVIGAVPLTAKYSPLVDVLVAGVEAVLVALEPATNGATVAHVRNIPNPHIGRAIIRHSAFHSPAAEYKAAWNAAAKDNGLTGAVLP